MPRYRVRLGPMVDISYDFRYAPPKEIAPNQYAKRLAPGEVVEFDATEEEAAALQRVWGWRLIVEAI